MDDTVMALRPRLLRLVTITAGLILGLTAGCSQHQPLTDGPAGPGAAPTGAYLLPTPPLRGGQAPAARTGSAAPLPLDSSNVEKQDNQGATGDKGGGTFAVIPGGEDVLEQAFVVLSEQLAADDRPVRLDLEMASADKPGGGGTLPLSYWLAAYSFSQARWLWLPPQAGMGDPEHTGAWNASGSILLPLNSTQLRERFCNATGQVFIAILVDSPVHSGTWSGVKLQPSSLTYLAKNDPNYLKTEPLPAELASAGDDGAGGIKVSLVGIPDGADRIYIERGEASTVSSLREPQSVMSQVGGLNPLRTASHAGWQRLGFIDTSTTDFDDPVNTINQMADALQPGTAYVYRAVAAALDGSQALSAASSNRQTAQLTATDTWVTVQLDTNPSDYLCLTFLTSSSPAVPAVSRTYLDTGVTPNQWRMSFQAATDSNGTTPWHAPVVLDPTADSQGPSSALLTVAGCPAICYEDTLNGHILYTISPVSDGSVWPLSNIVRVDDISGNQPSMAIVNGHPAVAYNDGGSLFYVEATTNDGEPGTAWPSTGGQHFIANASGLPYPSLIAEPSRILVAYNDNAVSFGGLSIAVSQDLTAANWSTFAIAPADVSYRAITALMVDLNPALCFVQGNTNQAVFVRASDNFGASPNDWTQPGATQFDSAAVQDCMGGNLALVGPGPQPVLAYVDSSTSEIMVAKATTNDGNVGEWGSAAPTGLFVGGTGNPQEYHVSVAEVNGHLALAYTNQTDGLPMYAILNPGAGA